MSWSTSDRHDELPADWPAIRAGVLRDARHQCQIRWRGCLGKATEVDHKRRGNDHSRSNLQAACSSCHGKKSAREGTAERARLRRLRKRPPERHPGRM